MKKEKCMECGIETSVKQLKIARFLSDYTQAILDGLNIIKSDLNPNKSRVMCSGFFCQHCYDQIFED